LPKKFLKPWESQKTIDHAQEAISLVQQNVHTTHH